jgi:hypothetical protein
MMQMISTLFAIENPVNTAISALFESDQDGFWVGLTPTLP